MALQVLLIIQSGHSYNVQMLMTHQEKRQTLFEGYLLSMTF